MQRWQKHILFWIVVYILWTYMKSLGAMSMDQWIVNLVHLGAYMSVYYVLRDLLLPRYFDKGRWLVFGLGIIISTLVTVVLWNWALNELCKVINLYSSTIPDTYGRYLLESIQMYVPGMILLAWESYEDQESEAQRLHEIEKDKLATELNYLKTQLNPQFLFNTLNNLKSFVEERSPKAPDMIMRLSAMLDYILYRSQRETIALQEEVQAIQDFVALEKLRLGDQLNVNVVVSGNTSKHIAPLVLLSMVENALKENIISNTDHLSLSIHIEADLKAIYCKVITKTPDGVVENNWSDIRRQLEITYPDHHALDHSLEDGVAITSLKLQPLYG